MLIFLELLAISNVSSKGREERKWDTCQAQWREESQSWVQQVKQNSFVFGSGDYANVSQSVEQFIGS